MRACNPSMSCNKPRPLLTHNTLYSCTHLWCPYNLCGRTNRLVANMKKYWCISGFSPNSDFMRAAYSLTSADVNSRCRPASSTLIGATEAGAAKDNCRAVASTFSGVKRYTFSTNILLSPSSFGAQPRRQWRFPARLLAWFHRFWENQKLHPQTYPQS